MIISVSFSNPYILEITINLAFYDSTYERLSFAVDVINRGKIIVIFSKMV